MDMNNINSFKPSDYDAVCTRSTLSSSALCLTACSLRFTQSTSQVPLKKVNKLVFVFEMEILFTIYRDASLQRGNCLYANFRYKYSDMREIIIVLVITFLQGFYNYIPESNPVSRVYRVAAVLYLQRVLHYNIIRLVKYVLYFYISTFHSMCAASNMAVICISLISCLPGHVPPVLLLLLLLLLLLGYFGC